MKMKRRRVTGYFLEAATEIARTEGIDSITIRKVSNKAGYNSATLYKYFANLEQLLAFTAIHCISGYLDNLAGILTSAKHPVLLFLDAWRCYCRYSFANPSVFMYIFASIHSNTVLSHMEAYNQEFPDDFANVSENIKRTIIAPDRKQRDTRLVQPCIDIGYFAQADTNDIIDLGYVLHEGLIYQITTLQEREDVETLVTQFLAYYETFLDAKRQPGTPDIATLRKNDNDTEK